MDGAIAALDSARAGISERERESKGRYSYYTDGPGWQRFRSRVGRGRPQIGWGRVALAGGRRCRSQEYLVGKAAEAAPTSDAR